MTAVREPRAARRIRREGVTPAIDWSAYEPRGFYARYGHPALDFVLLVLALAPAFAIGLIVGLATWACFRSASKIFYTQRRVGRRGEIFWIYKFRTMRDPEGTAHESWTRGEDGARVTPLGRFFRNTHLDELPQILNVLKGEMSFIGPRPEMEEIELWAAAQIPGFSARLVLKPGITGWAQITQGYTSRSVDQYAKKLAITERYRKHLTLWTDLAILGGTLVWMARGRGWQWNRPRALHKKPLRTEESERSRTPN